MFADVRCVALFRSFGELIWGHTNIHSVIFFTVLEWGMSLKKCIVSVFTAWCRERGGWCHKQRGAWLCLSPLPSLWVFSSCSSWSGGTRRRTSAQWKLSPPCRLLHRRSTCSRIRAGWAQKAGTVLCAGSPTPMPPCCPPRASCSVTAAFTHTWKVTTAAQSPDIPPNCNTSSRSTHQRAKASKQTRSTVWEMIYRHNMKIIFEAYSQLFSFFYTIN